MPLIPDLEIGIWNAWIFVLAWLFFNAADPNWLVRRHDFKALFKKSSTIPPYARTEKIVFVILMVIQVLLIVYSIFLPLRLGTAWFYTGLAVVLLGLTIWEIAGISWAATPISELLTPWQ